MQNYTEKFYKFIDNNALLGAKEVVPFVIELMQPKSVIDIGCGLATWLAVFKQHGVEEILGVDGDFVDINKLNIPPEYFLQHNLLNPLKVEQNFDLAVSLEVAEHLPIEKAESFVDTLVNLSPAILFSAAVPYQPGTRHLNCQWPNYWAKIFSEKGYVLFDCFRMKFWQNPNVPWWYAQNMFLFVKESCWQNYPILKQNFNPLNEPPLPIIHPEFYLKLQQGTSINQALSLLMKVISRAINNKYSLNKSHHN
ncbi:methyltransferase domain-containing protein [Nostoc sp.]|uniref:methyltransferase domain-containing protein n=1 Tax=Nostoc sp. TaxID=1180 RepID=UPI002FF983AB